MENLSQKRKISIMIAIMAAMFFAAINQTIVGTALPRIIAILGGMEYYTWVMTIYMLTSTIATVLVGKLSDIYGRKPFILTGIVVFMIGAFLCGTSADIFQLIIYRGVQGLGAGIIMATSFTAIGDLFSPRERGKWAGLMSSVFALSSVLGPALGGYIVDHMNWYWVYWIFLPLGIVAFVMILILFPKVERNKAESIDYWGSLFLTLTIVPLLLAFSWAGSKYDWASTEIISLFAGTVVALVIFLMIETRVKTPVLPLSLFKNGIVTLSNVIGFILNAGMMGAIMYIPFFTQGVLGISPTYSGYITMPMMLSMLVASTLSGQFMTKTGKYKKLALLGMVLLIAGMLMMHYMDSALMAILSMIVFGLGLGPAMSVFSLVIQNAVAPTQLGVVTASNQLFRNLGGTIGVAIMGTLMNHGITSRFKDQAASGQGVDLSKFDPAVQEQLAAFQNPQVLLNQPKLEEAINQAPAQMHDLLLKMVDNLKDALSHSLGIIFLYGAALLLIGFILTFFLKEIPLRTSNKGKTKSEPQKMAEDKAEPTTV
ncbi:DHA2 family efflux MFS transporter permease subunit [Paenibacillus albiflavus]|uniref:DHA2 family efflux MFS transporter permease subunit n=1 Tax=Paenibacillus albiflavus TaxID=2545760 RepID=A0A4R4E684_9BACL|nr:MDR family MFS transporter [Paenibacillus albiflavus]TCZ75194.1 DHA2 family efflux MFS transporter permease subunit [Paenibacillus albiflavus]